MTLRIIPESAVTRGLSSREGAGDQYMDRLIKLVPTEAIAAYPLLLDKAQDAGGQWAIYLLTWALLLVVLVLRCRTTYTPGEGPQWTAIAIAAVSFVIWVYAQKKGDFGLWALAASLAPDRLPDIRQGESEFLGSIGFAVWTLMAPLFYKGGSSAEF